MDAEQIFSAIGTSGLGALLGYGSARLNQLRQDRVALDGYLRHLHDELDYNRKLLDEMRSRYLEGLSVASLWAPASTTVGYLRFQAWDSLVRQGIIALVRAQQQGLLWQADRETREVARAVETAAADWSRRMDERDRVGEEADVAFAKLHAAKERAFREVRQKVDAAIETLDQAKGELRPPIDTVK